MAVLESHVEPSEEHDRRRERMERLVAELRERTAQVALGGGEKAVERHRSRGKLPARERIDRHSSSSRLSPPGTCTRDRPRPPGSSPASA